MSLLRSLPLSLPKVRLMQGHRNPLRALMELLLRCLPSLLRLALLLQYPQIPLPRTDLLPVNPLVRLEVDNHRLRPARLPPAHLRPLRPRQALVSLRRILHPPRVQL